MHLLAMKCEICGLYVQQILRPDIIMRLLHQVCKDLGEPLAEWNLHSSNSMQNRRCGKQQYPGKDQAAPGLVRPCTGVHKKKTLASLLVVDAGQGSLAKGSRLASVLNPPLVLSQTIEFRRSHGKSAPVKDPAHCKLSFGKPSVDLSAWVFSSSDVHSGGL